MVFVMKTVIANILKRQFANSLNFTRPMIINSFLKFDCFP